MYSWWQRNRRRILVGGGLAASGVLLYKFAERKLDEFREAEAQETLKRARKQHHFDANQRTCNMTALSMATTLGDALKAKVDTDKLFHLLQAKPENKIQLWEEIKVLCFTRTMAAVYGTCLLVVTLRVQLNLLGGYMYLDAIEGHNHLGIVQKVPVATQEVQQRYLSAIQHLVQNGLDDIIGRIDIAVREVVAPLSLKKELTVRDLLGIIMVIRDKVESGESIHPTTGSTTTTGHAICAPTFQSLIDAALMPDLAAPAPSSASDAGAAASSSAAPTPQPMTREDIIVTKMAADTREVMATPDFASLLNLCLKIAFMRVGEQLGEHYAAASSPSLQPPVAGASVENGKILPPAPPKLPLAKIVPWMSGLVNAVCSSPPNMFMQELLLLEPLKQFSCNVYDAFSQEGKF